MNKSIATWGAAVVVAVLVGCATTPAPGFDIERRITVQPPTEVVSGEPLDPETDIEYYTVYCMEEGAGRFPNSGLTIAGFRSGPFTLTTTNGEVLERPGSYLCATTATDVEGRESARSEPVPVRWETEAN